MGMAAGLGLLLMAGGGVVALFAGISLLIAAFKKSLFWGLGYLLVPGVSLAFVLCHWDETKDQLLLWLKGAVAVVVGVIVVNYAAPSSMYKRRQAKEPIAEREGPAEPERPVPVAAAQVPAPTPLPRAALVPPSLTVPPLPAGIAAIEGPAVGLRVYFRNPFRSGRITIQANGQEVYSYNTDIDKNEEVPAIDSAVLLRPDVSELKLWVVATNRNPNLYRSFPVAFTAGEWHTLNLEMQDAGLAVALQ